MCLATFHSPRLVESCVLSPLGESDASPTSVALQTLPCVPFFSGRCLLICFLHCLKLWPLVEPAESSARTSSEFLNLMLVWGTPGPAGGIRNDVLCRKGSLSSCNYLPLFSSGPIYPDSTSYCSHQFGKKKSSH